MIRIQILSLYVLCLCCTFYAGLGVFFIICPFPEHFDTITYAKWWQVVDRYMGARMPIFGQTWLAVFLFNLVVFFKTRKYSPIFWMMLVSLILLLGDFVLTAKSQIPINQFFQSIDLNNLTTIQIQQLQKLREQSNSNFAIRHIAQYGIFFIMSITPFLLWKLNNRKQSNKVKENQEA